MIRFGGSYGSASSSPSYYDFLAGTANSTLPTGVTLTRASSATRRNSSALIETVSTDVPAWQYAVGGATRGLRVFGAATNLIKQGTVLSGTSTTFAPTRASLSGTTTAPDGTNTAPKLIEDTTASNSHRMSASGLSSTSGTVYTFSVYAKAAERSWLGLRVFSPDFLGTTASAYFNLGTGVVGTKDAGITTSGIEDAGNGWYRCWVTFTAATTSSSGALTIDMATADATINYTGDGTSGLYLWGAQFEAGAGPTSFIPTTTATVTRAADTGLITSGYPLADQTWVIRARTPMFTPSSGTKQVLFQVDNGTDNNRRVIYRDTSNKIIVQTDVGGVTQAALDLGAVASDTDFVVSARYADNLFAASLNGAAIVTDLSGTNPLGLTTARVGKDSTGNHWNSTIRIIETRRTASDTELPLLCA